VNTQNLNNTQLVEDRKWYIVDATDMVLGRLSAQVASVLKGKHKPTYAPNYDNGDFVIIVNAEKIRVTGKKADTKSYFRHTGYVGNEKHISYKHMMEFHPERIIEHAVKGMLPKNSLGRQMFKKLKVYAGEEHNHKAQQPIKLELKYK
jgi:large subunit ribosomal protein L13